jgi:hypothetical protein
VAAYNVAPYLKCDDDVDFLQIANYFTKLVRQFILPFSGDHIHDESKLK